MKRCAAETIRSTYNSPKHYLCRCFASGSTRGPRWPALEDLEQGLGDDGRGNPLKIDNVSKTVTTAAGVLPISPIMDPQWAEATRKFRSGKERGRKPQPNDPYFGRFRKLLLQNPYAQALATPVRMCAVSRTKLPRYFLDGLTVVKGPNERPWWVPHELTEKPRTRVVKLPGEEKSDETDAPDEVPVLMEATAPGEMGSEALDTKSSSTDEAPPQRTPNGYVLARKSIYRLMDDEAVNSRLSPGHRRLGSQKSMKRALDAVWRDGMDDFALDTHRRLAVEELLHLATISEGGGSQYLAPCASWGAVPQLKHKRGCVLWQSFDGAVESASFSKAKSMDQDPGLPGTGDPPWTLSGAPGEFATMDLEGAKYCSRIPVHNLHYLLGNDNLAKLREKSRLFRDNTLIMLARKGSLSTQLRLWKLQGFLASYGEPREAWDRRKDTPKPPRKQLKA